MKVEISEFEKKTSYCPLYLAWRIVDEACDYFRTPIPEAFADKLARRAEAVFSNQPFWQRKYQSARGREYILMSMRHWLAGVLARERLALFRALPESFKIGHPIQETLHPVAAVYDRLPRSKFKPRRSQSTATTAARFIHGCELLTV